MRYVLKRRKDLYSYYAGTANTAFDDKPLNIRKDLECSPNEIAVCFDATVFLAVSGGNADGDDSFSVHRQKLGGTSVSFQYLWKETIAAATLIANYRKDTHLPGDNSDTEHRAPYVMLEDQEDVLVSATAGGALVVYWLGIYGTWWIYEEIKEQINQETPVMPSPIPIPQRAGWWQ